MTEPVPFTCPQCKMVSYHPTDIEQRYCARCHQWADDMPVAKGLYGLSCFNALSHDWQVFLVREGYLPIDYNHRPRGTCLKAAEVGLEVDHRLGLERAPGPRFYCLGCAAEYLASLSAKVPSV